MHRGRHLGDTAAELVLTLATVVCREAGLMLELDDVAVQSLVPEPLQAEESPAAFMKALPEFDGEMDAQLQAAEAEDQCLRFVGKQQSVQTSSQSLHDVCTTKVRHSARKNEMRARACRCSTQRITWACYSAELVLQAAFLSLVVFMHGSLVLPH